MANTTITDSSVAGGAAINMKATQLTWGTQVWAGIPNAVTGSGVPNAECDAMGVANPRIVLNGKWAVVQDSGTTTISWNNLISLIQSSNKKLLTDDLIGTGSVYIAGDVSVTKDANVEGDDVINYSINMVLTK